MIKCKFCNSKKVLAKVIGIGFLTYTYALECTVCKRSYNQKIDMYKNPTKKYLTRKRKESTNEDNMNLK